VTATGEQHSVREFVEEAFSFLDLDYRDYVKIDPQLLHPADVETLLGDASKAKWELGWSYTVSFKQLVRQMVNADLALLRHPQA
jgi:GDPmannose 4,6-dehydratase